MTPGPSSDGSHRHRALLLLDRVEVARDQVLSSVAALSPELRMRSPAPGKWCILEIVEHMVIAEEDVMAGFVDLEQRTPRRRRFRHRVLYRVVMFILRHGIPVKVPSETMRPSGKVALADLAERWSDNHATLRAFVDGLDAAALRQPIFGHPVAGPITVGEALRMLEVHLARHAGQIDGIVSRHRSRGR